MITTSWPSGSSALGQRGAWAQAAGQRADGLVGRVQARVRAELRERAREVVAPAQDRVLVGGAQRDVAPPRLAARPVELGATDREQLQRRGPAAAAHRVGQQRSLVRIATRVEEQPHVLGVVLVEGPGEGVRAAHVRAVVEQQLQARRAARLDGVVHRLAVVGVRARLQQRAGHRGIADDADGAVERGHRPVLVAIRRVRVSAAGEQLPQELDGREARVAEVHDRRPAARTAGRVHVARPAAAEDERGPRVAHDPRTRREECLGPGAAPARGGEDERLGVRLRGGDERRPAREALLAGDRELGAREDRVTSAEALQRALVACSRVPHELLRLLAQLLQIHDDLPGCGPASALPGQGDRRSRPTGPALRGGRCPSRGPDAPSRAGRS